MIRKNYKIGEASTLFQIDYLVVILITFLQGFTVLQIEEIIYLENDTVEQWPTYLQENVMSFSSRPNV